MSSSGGLYLFLGSDRSRKLQRLHELERSLKIHTLDRHQLDASTLTATDLLAVCRQQPAASPVRLVVVDQAERMTRACLEALREHASVIAQTAAVILLVEQELTVRHPLSQAVEAFTTERFVERPAAAAANPFALTDALGRQDAAGSLTALREQLRAGKEPLELLGLVAWQVGRWVTIKRLLSGDNHPERIASLTGLRAWQVERIQSEVARRSLASLQALLTRCWQLDVDAKSGRASAELAVEQLVMEACVPGGA